MRKNLFIYFLFIGAVIHAQNGIVRSYYSKGKIESKLSYANDILEGTSYWYYQNGNLKEEKTYSRGKLNGWVRAYYETGLLREEISVKDGIRDGITKLYYENGGLKEVLTYENGILTKRVTVGFDVSYVPSIEEYNAGNRQYEIKKREEEELICDADICPEPIGGMKLIYDRLKIPEAAIQNQINGTVVLLAVINEKGNVEETQIIKGVVPEFDKAAEEAVKSARFLPGQKDGKLVTSRVTLRIEFGDEKLTLKEPGIPPLIDSTVHKEELAAASENINNVPKPPADNSGQSEVLEKGTIAVNNEDIQKEEIPVPVTKPDENINTETADKPKLDNIFSISCDVEVCPQVIGGNEKLISGFQIPKRVIKKGLEGRVVVKVFIDEHGKVTSTEVIEDVGLGAGVAAEVAILETSFEAAKVNGRPVKCEAVITLPVIISR